jgi:chromosome partitioning protein
MACMVITVCTQKGGSGKTTTVTAIAGELVARGFRVLVVDADPQGSLRTWAHKAKEKGYAAPVVVAMGGEQLSGDGDLLTPLIEKFDHIVIDCPGWSVATDIGHKVQRHALFAASIAILPCGPQAFDGWGLKASIRFVREAMLLRDDLAAYVLITRKRNTKLGRGAREALQGAGDCLPLLDTELGYRDAYEAAPAVGLGAGQYDPDDPAAAEVAALVDEILARGEKRYGQATSVAC